MSLKNNLNRTNHLSYASDPGGGGSLRVPKSVGESFLIQNNPNLINSTQFNDKLAKIIKPSTLLPSTNDYYCDHRSLINNHLNDHHQQQSSIQSPSSTSSSMISNNLLSSSSLPPSLLTSNHHPNHLNNNRKFRKNYHHHHHQHQQQQQVLNQNDQSLSMKMFDKFNYQSWIKVKQSSLKSTEILYRPAWFDAELALNLIDKGKAYGNRRSLWLRFFVQAKLFELGLLIHKNSGALLFLASLLLLVCLAGLKSVHIEDNVEKLWIETGGRLEKELQFVHNILGEGYGTTDQIIIQTPKNRFDTILNTSALLFHLKVMRTAVTTSIEMFDATWNLKDICYTPSSPYFDRHHLDSLLENIFPCSIITPLDCFWEGSKLLGPEIPVKIPGYNQQVQWTNLNPQQMIDLMLTLMKQSIESSGAISNDNNNNNNYQNNLNPILRPFETMRKFMKNAGITTAYQTKQCLDPSDLNCPQSSPNKQSGQVPNVGKELTNGCYGFATKYMHWIEDLIVGGITKNRSGNIVRAKALQSIIQLMGEQNLYEYHQRTIKVQHLMDWSVEKARAILHAWQRKFAEELNHFLAETDFIGSQQYNVNYFTTSSLADIMKNFSQINFINLSIGYLLMLLHAGISLSRWYNFNDEKIADNHERFERSKSLLAIFGVLLIALSIASGLGVCALIGLSFNATTTQIVPLLASGLSIDYIFLLTKNYQSNYMIKHIPIEYRTAECLKQIGFNILLSLLCNLVAFTVASIIPIPALRNFCLQTAILIAFTTIAVLVLYPALISIDLRLNNLYFKFIINHESPTPGKLLKFLINLSYYLTCCRTPKSSSTIKSIAIDQSSIQSNNNNQQRSSHLSASSSSSASLFKQPYQHRQPYNYEYLNSINKSIKNKNTNANENLTDAVCNCDQQNNQNKHGDINLMLKQCNNCGRNVVNDQQKLNSKNILTTTNNSNDDDYGNEQQPSSQPVATSRLSIKYFVQNYLAKLLQPKTFKILILLLYSIIIVMSMVGGIAKINDGLDLVDLVPKQTNEYEFLRLRQKYFSYYNVFMITKGNFDYPNGQRLLSDYYQSFNNIDAIIKNDDGGLPGNFWLHIFRDWLLQLQNQFDIEYRQGAITREQWFANASSDAILAYKLLVQTGRQDNPIDKSLILTGRLVDSGGIINTRAFYNYLTAWVSNDVMGYGQSQASFKPEPRQWIHEPNDVELRIPKSSPLIYAQIPFNLNNIRTTEEIIDTIVNIRENCKRFEQRGLANFPHGVPFTYWEQYLNLRFYMFLTLFLVLFGIFLSTSLFTMNIRTSIIITMNLIINIIILFGFMGLIGIKLSALPVVTLIVSIIISLNPLIHLNISFNTALGNHNKRMSLALEHMSNPIINGIISTLFGLLMLAFSEFDFIIRYFFLILGASIVIVTINSFILLPILLSMIGPESDLRSHEHDDHISPPTPPATPILTPSSINHHHHHHYYHHHHNGGNKAFDDMTKVINVDDIVDDDFDDVFEDSTFNNTTTNDNRYIEALMLESKRKNSRQKSMLNRTSSFSGYNGRYYSRKQQRIELQKLHNSQISLSTISEEPQSYQSTPTPSITATTTPTPLPAANQTQQFTGNIITQPAAAAAPLPQPQPIVVQPEFVVETTITNNNPGNNNQTPTSEIGSSSASSSPTSSAESPSPSNDNDNNNSNNSRCESSNSTTTSSSSSSSTTVTTKVMATAKLQIELRPYTPSPTSPVPLVCSSSSQPSSSTIMTPQPPPATQHYYHPIIPTMISFPGANYHHSNSNNTPIYMSPPQPSSIAYHQQQPIVADNYFYYPQRQPPSVIVNHHHLNNNSNNQQNRRQQFR